YQRFFDDRFRIAAPRLFFGWKIGRSLWPPRNHLYQWNIDDHSNFHLANDPDAQSVEDDGVCAIELAASFTPRTEPTQWFRGQKKFGYAPAIPGLAPSSI